MFSLRGEQQANKHEEIPMKTSWRMTLQISAIALASALAVGAAHAGEAEAKKWISSEFQPSTLSQDKQMAEMKWFIDAAAKLKAKGVTEIHVVSETLDTHAYESKTLAKAFEEITGIKVKHDIMQEGDVVEKLQTSMQSGKSIYDGWISDSDLIGTHYRYGVIMPLSDYMAGEGKEFTNPGLDLKDFIGTSFTTASDGKLYQLPDQQFANLYWFRADWFARKDLQDKFKAKYGYDLGVPVNWTAYEDIANFFTNDVKELDGKRIYGHMDYGKKDPSLGWRFTDAWLSMAGSADKGIPNGLPVDEWGIRAENCAPVGASMSRGGATNSPAAVYAQRVDRRIADTVARQHLRREHDRRAAGVCGAGLLVAAGLHEEDPLGEADPERREPVIEPPHRLGDRAAIAVAPCEDTPRRKGPVLGTADGACRLETRLPVKRAHPPGEIVIGAEELAPLRHRRQHQLAPLAERHRLRA
jgi:ABC-type glycerol-3-phosphate transport system substrate-binding protein